MIDNCDHKYEYEFPTKTQSIKLSFMNFISLGFFSYQYLENYKCIYCGKELEIGDYGI